MTACNILPHLQPYLPHEDANIHACVEVKCKRGTMQAERLKPKALRSQSSNTMLDQELFQKLELLGNWPTMYIKLLNRLDTHSLFHDVTISTFNFGSLEMFGKLTRI